MLAVMTSLEKFIVQRLGDARERQFFSHSLNYLSIVSGHHVVLENWMITSYEVEFMSEIGSGGL